MSRLVPVPPDGLLPTTVETWAAYWSDDIARLVTPIDREALVVRWITYLDEHARALAAYRKQRMVLGSTKQPKISDYFKAAMELDARIDRLEQRLGIGPLYRMKLGIAFGDATKSLGELNALADVGDEDEDDPYAALLQPTADEGREEAPEPRG